LPADYTFSAADAGSHTFSATLFTAGTQSLKATDTATASITGSESSITVKGAAPQSLAVSGFPTTDTAGTWGLVTVAALDAYGNVASGYAGTIHFTSSDGHAALPADYTFAAAAPATHAVYVDLLTAGTQSITAADTANPSFTASDSGIAVSPAAVKSLKVTGFPSPDTAGTANSVTVAAVDAYGNLVTGYTGTIHFTSSDRQASLPADYTFSAADAGSHTFSATLFTAGTQSLKATDTATASITGSESSITVKGAAPQSLAVSGFPTTDTAGTWSLVTVAALDAYGNVASGYAGTVHFKSSGTAYLPADYTFSAAVPATHAVYVDLLTAGTQSITATDTVNPSFTASESGITVLPAAVKSLKVTGFPSPDSAGTANSVTVAAVDAYGNVVTNFVGTVSLSSSDTQALLPASYTFTAADAGTYTFSVTLKTKGTQSITATDLADGLSGSETGIVVQ
jgi:S-adenosylmethionine hydrolase